MVDLDPFLCTFLLSEKGFSSYLWLLSFVVVLVGNSLFHFLSDAYFVAMATFFIGFFVNTYRIKLREFMYEAVSNTQEILLWTGRITAMSSFVKAFAPLMLAFISLAPSFIFMLCGVLISIGFLMIQISYYFVTSQTLKKKLSMRKAISSSAS